MSQRVAWSRTKVAEGHPVATVARIANISRQAIYKTPTPTMKPQSRDISDPIEQKILDTCNEDDYRTDGYRMISAIVSRLLGRPVNRKRVLRVMRKHKLIQRKARPERRRRPGKFTVTRPDQLWHLDMTSVWVAEHGWTLRGTKTRFILRRGVLGCVDAVSPSSIWSSASSLDSPRRVRRETVRRRSWSSTKSRS